VPGGGEGRFAQMDKAKNNKQSNRTEFAEDCNNNTANNATTNTTNNQKNKNK